MGTITLTNKSNNNITMEKNTGKRLTVSAGYIPIAQQIRMLEDAGQKLVRAREAQFDWNNDAEIRNVTDTTRKLYNQDPAYLAGALYESRRDIERIKRQKKLDKIKKTQQNDTKVSSGDNIDKEKVIANSQKGGE